MHRWETESKKKEAASLQRPSCGVRARAVLSWQKLSKRCASFAVASQWSRKGNLLLSSFRLSSILSSLLSLSFLFCCWDRSLLCSFWLSLYTFDWHGTHGDPPASVSFMPDDRWASASQYLTPFLSLSQISARNTLCPCYCYYRYWLTKPGSVCSRCYTLWLSALPVSDSSQ